MKYTEDQLKKIVLAALEESGYYHSRWVKGTDEDREKKGYFNGRADALLMLYGVEGFEKTEEAQAAYNRGKNRYYHEADDN